MASRDPQSTQTKRLTREAAELARDPPPNCSGGPRNGNLRIWDASIVGPEDSVYAGGVFSLEMTMPNAYPFQPPKVCECNVDDRLMQVKFCTRIYHMNINGQGSVCLDILKNDW
jgi:ubiquitin-protein ligase